VLGGQGANKRTQEGETHGNEQISPGRGVGGEKDQHEKEKTKQMRGEKREEIVSPGATLNLRGLFTDVYKMAAQE